MDLLNASAKGVGFNLFMQGAIGAHILFSSVLGFNRSVVRENPSGLSPVRSAQLQFMSETDLQRSRIAEKRVCLHEDLFISGEYILRLSSTLTKTHNGHTTSA
jgi:hypothetical protein